MKKVENASRLAIQAFTWVNDNYMSFVGYGTCDRVIWTSGTSKKRMVRVMKNDSEPVCGVRSLSNTNFLGFFNSPHKDLCDVLDEVTKAKWLGDIANSPSMQDYLRGMDKICGLGLPTTCGYNVIGNPGSGKLLAYFCQMGFCVPICHTSAHHFYGWSFPHCTAMPVVVGESYKYRNQPDEDPLVIAAWGSSGKKGHANARVYRNRR